jgi:hypothetical protein
MYKPEVRISWDKSIKQIKTLDSGEGYSIIHIHYDSPMFLIAERDLVDKFINFYHDGVYYSLSTSVGTEVFDPIKGVVRCLNYLNLFALTEDDQFYYLSNFNQCDVKVW